jgi:inner membrane protein
MASPLGHTAIALALGVALQPPRPPRRYWLLGAVCSIVPDLDLIGRLFPNREVEALLGGHRGLTHSAPFAVLLGLLITLVAFRGPPWTAYRRQLWRYFTAATLSHGLVDCLTTYGPGVALLAPLSWIRWKAPWQPLGRGACRGPLDCLVQGLSGELLWLGLPAVLLAAIIVLWRRSHDRSVRAAA